MKVCYSTSRTAHGFYIFGPLQNISSLCQLRVGRSFVNKNEPGQFRVEESLAPVDPQVTRSGDLRPKLFGGLETFSMTEPDPMQQAEDR